VKTSLAAARLLHPQEARLGPRVMCSRCVLSKLAVFAESGLRALGRSERLPEKEHRRPFSLIGYPAPRNTLIVYRENAAEKPLC